MMDFPNYQQLVTSVADRDMAIAAIVLSVLIVIAWLCLARWLQPRFLPVLRNTILIVFYVTIPIFLLWRFR